jgi:hypothetical protein
MAKEGNRGPSVPNGPHIYQALPGKSEGCLSLKIRLDKEVYRSGEPIRVTLALKNMCDTPLLINHRIALWHEIRLHIKDNKGLTLRWLPPAPPPPLTINNFSTLAPQQQLSWEIGNVNQILYDKLVPGIYMITATYQNTSGEELGIHAWTGQLESNPVSFEVAGQ